MVHTNLGQSEVSAEGCADGGTNPLMFSSLFGNDIHSQIVVLRMEVQELRRVIISLAVAMQLPGDAAALRAVRKVLHAYQVKVMESELGGPEQLTKSYN